MEKQNEKDKMSIGDGIAWAGFWLALSLYLTARVISGVL